MKVFIVVSNSDFSAITKAESKDEAIFKVANVYENEYGDVRDDWDAYVLSTYMLPEDVFELRTPGY